MLGEKLSLFGAVQFYLQGACEVVKAVVTAPLRTKEIAERFKQEKKNPR